ncbi:MAG: AAA family ATPase [Spirochaetales bacterium]|nr:AAA family ATPase [Spirochaetales bacterium]
MEKKKIPITKRIEYLIRARYSILYIVSSEEARVIDSIRNIAFERAKKERTKEMCIWSITKGLEMGENKILADLREPLKVLDHIIEEDIEGFFILKDFHPYMKDPVVMRKLRDANRAIKNQYKNIFILSPIVNIPIELEKEIALVDFDLPSKEEIDSIIELILRAIGNPTKVNVYNDQLFRDKVIDAALGLTAEEAENVFAKSLVQTGDFDIDIILSEKEQIIRKSGVLEYYKTMYDFQDVGGLENLKAWIKRRGLAFTDKARQFGLPQPKGILLIGIPGCGKSLTAKAISALWKFPLLRLDVGKVFSSLVGSSEENIRRAIQTAESIAPSILWLDELEKGFSGIGSSNVSDAGTTARVFGTFLTWLQEKESSVFVFATSNNISQLPPELLRKGRFDEIFYIDLPTKIERKEIFSIHLRKRNRNPESFDLDTLADLTVGYSGSEIEEIIISGLYEAFEHGKELDDGKLLRSTKDMIPLSQTMKEEIKIIREWAKTRARKASITSFEDEEEDNYRKIEMK